MPLSFYKTVEIAENTFRIKEEHFVNAYLAIGSEKALLVDTGNGSGNILEEVRKITELPIVAAATHAHGDHLGGAGWFESVLVNKAELAPVYEIISGPFASMVAAKMFGVPYHSVKQPNKRKLVPFSLPLVIELGGRSFEAVALPGHTAGSTGFLDRENHLLFCGDAAGKLLQMISPGTLPLYIQRETVEKALALAQDNALWWGHLDGAVSAAELEALLSDLDEVLATQPKNALIGHSKKSPGGLIMYNTGRVF